MALAIHCPHPHHFSLYKRKPWCNTQTNRPPIVLVKQQGRDFVENDEDSIIVEAGTVVTCRTCTRLLFAHGQYYALMRSKGITVKTEGADTSKLWDKGPAQPTRSRRKPDKRQLDFGDLFED